MKIIDFEKYTQESNATNSANLMILAAAFQAFQDATQEINFAIKVMANAGLTSENYKKILTKYNDAVSATDLLAFQDLLNTHGNNLIVLAESIKPLTKNPQADKEKAAIADRKEAIAKDYLQQRIPFVINYIEQMEKTLKEGKK